MMYAKSFMVLDGNERLTGALTAQSALYDRYRCPLCGSAMTFHPEYHAERPWFEHRQNTLTARGRHCPYVKPKRVEMQRIKQLRRYVPDARALIRKTDWLCAGCDSHYHGEQNCLICHTGKHSRHANPSEVTVCAC